MRKKLDSRSPSRCKGPNMTYPSSWKNELSWISYHIIILVFEPTCRNRWRTSLYYSLTQVLIRLVFPFHLSILRISKEARPLLACTSLYRDWLSKGVEGTLMLIGYFRDIVVYAWGTFCAFGKIVFTSLSQPMQQSLRFEWKLPEASLFPSLGWNGSWSLFASGGLYDQSRRAFF